MSVGNIELIAKMRSLIVRVGILHSRRFFSQIASEVFHKFIVAQPSEAEIRKDMNVAVVFGI